ncbi:MAG: VCBS repeat-containing protein [bacterium]|nr:VCBS repeat-containing protein [bacterium]
MVPQLLIGLTLLVLGAMPAQAQNFTSRVLARDMGGAVDVSARDFDGDGDVDLMVSTMNPGGVYYYDRRPDTLMAFEAYVAGGAGRQVTSGDFDGDGDLDAIFASFGENRLVLLRNTDSNQPSTRFSPVNMGVGSTGPFAVLGGDFTGDGLTDLVASEVTGTDKVRLYRQIAGAQEEIWLSSFYGGLDPLGMTIADLENDGVKEIFIAVGSTNGGLYMMRRTQTGSYALSQEINNAYLVAVAVVDLDNDGALDALGCDFEDDAVRRWEKTATGWVNIPLNGSMNNPRDIVVEDFNSDGLLDFAATGEGQSGGGGGVSWWRQTSNGTFVIQDLSTSSGFFGLDIVDYDRDGDIDLIACNRETEQVYLFENRMGTPTRIIGHVTAERGAAPVEGVRVTAVETGVSGETDVNGRYEMGMIEGTFTLRFEHPCWQTSDLTGIQTFADDTTFADKVLRRPVMELPVTSLNLFVQNDLSLTYELWISNSGDAPLTVSNVSQQIAPNGSWVSVSPSAIEVAPEDSGMFGVTFTPDTSNDNNYEILGSLNLRTNSCPDSLVDLALVIVVLDAPEVGGALMPLKTNLAPAYPNPFNPTVTLPVEIAQGGISLCASTISWVAKQQVSLTGDWNTVDLNLCGRRVDWRRGVTSRYCKRVTARVMKLH